MVTVKSYHEHPLRILRYSIKNIWLLIFPLLRGLRTIKLNSRWFYEWLQGAWFDIAILVLIVIFGLVQWYFSRIILTAASITHKYGVIFRVNTTIPYCNISSTSYERPMYLSPFGAVRLRCDTRAGIFRVSDMKLMVRERIIPELKAKLPGIKEEDERYVFPKTPVLSVVLFSIFFSSGFTGTVYIATFFFKGGDIARDMVGSYLDRITESTERFTGKLLQRIPDAAIGLGILFIGAWLISFFINITRYYDFSLATADKCVKLNYGVFNRKEYGLVKEHINYIDIRQNLIMKSFRAIAVHVSCAGYGNSRKSLPVLLTVRRESGIHDELEKIGINRGANDRFKPVWTGFWQYVWIPVIVSASLVPVYMIVPKALPFFDTLTVFVAIMAEVPAVWLIAVKTAAFFTSGVSLYDDRIMLRYNRFTTFHTIIADRRKLVKVELEQTIFQKIGRRGSLSFWFEGEIKRRHKVRALSLKDIETISQLLDIELLSLIRA